MRPAATARHALSAAAFVAQQVEDAGNEFFLATSPSVASVTGKYFVSNRETRVSSEMRLADGVRVLHRYPEPIVRTCSLRGCRTMRTSSGSCGRCGSGRRASGCPSDARTDARASRPSAFRGSDGPFITPEAFRARHRCIEGLVVASGPFLVKPEAGRLEPASRARAAPWVSAHVAPAVSLVVRCVGCPNCI